MGNAMAMQHLPRARHDTMRTWPPTIPRRRWRPPRTTNMSWPNLWQRELQDLNDCIFDSKEMGPSSLTHSLQTWLPIQSNSEDHHPGAPPCQEKASIGALRLQEAPPTTTTRLHDGGKPRCHLFSTPAQTKIRRDT